MRVHSSTRFLALAALTGALACASNKARTEETTPEQAAAARDTTGRDTLAGDTLTQNPPGYRGMERDTTMPEHQQTPTDTFLQHQGQREGQDTSGYSGIERVDTTGQRVDTTGQDTSGYNAPTDTSGYRQDTSGYNPSAGQADTSGYNAYPSPGQDTTGRDTTGMDTTGMRSDTTGARSGAAGLDSTGMSKTGDTTGYQPSQQDTTSAR